MYFFNLNNTYSYPVDVYFLFWYNTCPSLFALLTGWRSAATKPFGFACESGPRNLVEEKVG